MSYFGKIFVEFWDDNRWNLAAVKWWQYLFMRLSGVCGNSTADIRYYNCRHVPRKNISFDN